MQSSENLSSASFVMGIKRKKYMYVGKNETKGLAIKSNSLDSKQSKCIKESLIKKLML